jgi:hypothetical protein
LTAEGRAQAEADDAAGPALLEGAVHLVASLVSREEYAARHRRTASLTRSAPRPASSPPRSTTSAGTSPGARAFARVAAAAEDAWTPELRAALPALDDAGVTRQAAPRLQAEAGQ